MELPIVILCYSLLLGLQFVVVVGSVPNEWAESSVDVAIDPWKGSDDFVQPVTLSAPEEENDAKPVTVDADEGGASDRSASAVATPTGRGKLSERAAEILGTSDNRQQAAISSSSVLPNTPETVSTQSTHLSTQETTMSSSSSLMPVSESTTVTSTTTETTISSTSIQLPSEPSDETIQPDETNTTSIAIVSTISSLNESTAQSNPNGNEEYFADDAASSSSTTDAIVDEDETTVVTDKSTIVHHFDLDSSVQHSNTSPALVVEETTSTTEMSRPSLAVSSVVAVGRALSQEESVPWPEAKSTKVIGTIIEDIHGPFSDGVSSVSTSSPDVLTSSGIAAIVMCTFLVFLTTAGASGYWWYRRRYLLNRPETLSERYAPSESGLGAGEDIFRVGYVHSPELPRDSSEEMYSLDNDSFLTSLEAMTIPTYWTESIKHTKL